MVSESQKSQATLKLKIAKNKLTRDRGFWCSLLFGVKFFKFSPLFPIYYLNPPVLPSTKCFNLLMILGLDSEVADLSWKLLEASFFI